MYGGIDYVLAETINPKIRQFSYYVQSSLRGAIMMTSIVVSFALVVSLLGPTEINPCASGAAFAQTSAARCAAKARLVGIVA